MHFSAADFVVVVNTRGLNPPTTQVHSYSLGLV